MDILIDVNVAIDVLTKREPFYQASWKALSICLRDGFRGVLWSGEITTIHYLLQKPLGKEAARAHVRSLLELFDIADVTKELMVTAEESGMPDYEDAVIAYCAKRAKADCIITRNTADFQGSPVPAITPEAFLERHQS